MLQSISLNELSEQLRVDHPTWTVQGADEHAAQMIECIDDRLSGVVQGYLRDAVESDYRTEGMSLLGLRSLMRCTYLEAISVMSVWLKNPAEARAIVTRRGMAR